MPYLKSTRQARFFKDGLGGGIHDFPDKFQFIDVTGQGDHDFRMDIHAVAFDPDGRFQDGPDLHFGDLRHDHAQAVAAQAEHGIGFLQGLDPVEDVFLLAQLSQGLVDLAQGMIVLDADL